MATVECSEHRKKRSERNMIRDGKGGWCCMPGFDCQKSLEERGNVCSVHGKKRNSICLESDGFGGQKCKEEFQCKGGTVPKVVRDCWAQMDVPESAGVWVTAKEGDWNCPACGEFQFAKAEACKKCQTPKPPEASLPGAMPLTAGTWMSAKPGDWNCPGCGDLQFARNETCRKCRTPRQAGLFSKPGDWNCPGCGDLQFARNISCRKCGTQRPESAGLLHQMAAQVWNGSKPGDWNCPGCGDLQFARNEVCRQCKTPRPADATAAFNPPPMSSGAWISGMSAKPGDWNCPGCGDLQFARQAQCRKCNTDRPPEALAAMHLAASSASQQAASLQASGWGDPGADAIAYNEEALALAQQEAYHAAYLQGLMQGNMLGAMQAQEQAAEEAAPAAAAPAPAPTPAPDTWKCPGCGNVQFCTAEKCPRCRTPQPGTAAAAAAANPVPATNGNNAGGLAEYAQALGIPMDAKAGSSSSGGSSAPVINSSGRKSRWSPY